MNTNNPREFWNKLNNLGPRKKTQIPMEVYDSEGNITNNTNTVLNTWKSEFNELYKGYKNSEFDTNIYEYIQAEEAKLESACITMNKGNINQIISIKEVCKVLNNMRNNKAVGIDNLPYEVLKNTESTNRIIPQSIPNTYYTFIKEKVYN